MVLCNEAIVDLMAIFVVMIKHMYSLPELFLRHFPRHERNFRSMEFP